MDNKKAYICEIFFSIQGEGIYVGERQLFIRFSGCNLRCKFCDTEYARERREFCVVGNAPSLSLSPQRVERMVERDKKIKNPVSLDILIAEIENLRGQVCFKTVSLTGGEPLLQSEFINELAKKLKEKNYILYLETNGTLVDELGKVIDFIDIVSMDLKLHFSTGCGDLINVHKRFLQRASKKEVFIKVVVTEETEENEFESAIYQISKIEDVELVVQPSSKEKYDFNKLLKFQEIAMKYLSSVRIIPQMHRIIGIR